jgi:hypothetical protein
MRKTHEKKLRGALNRANEKYSEGIWTEQMRKTWEGI